jgi:TPR repeat protein
MVLGIATVAVLLSGGCAPMSPPSPSGPSGSGVRQDAGELFSRGVEYGKAQDYAEAAKWYRQAADQGHPRARYNLGFLYAKGQGVPQDYAEAAKWYRQAADQGVPRAQNNLGDLYENGQGVPQDYAEAIKWYRLAAKGGNRVAYSNLGSMYKKGLGVPRDPVQAYIWFNLATATRTGPKRDEDIKERDALAAQMTPAQRAATQKPPEEAQKHYKVALVALKNNDLNVAVEELQKAAKGAPGNASILYSLATVQAKQGNTEQAKKNLELAKQLGLPAEERSAVEELEATVSYQTQKQRNYFVGA